MHQSFDELHLKKVTESYFLVLPGGDVDEEVPIEVHQVFDSSFMGDGLFSFGFLFFDCK